MKVTSLKQETEKTIGITVVELDSSEANQYKTSSAFKTNLMTLAEGTARKSNCKGIIIEEYMSSDYLDIFMLGELST